MVSPEQRKQVAHEVVGHRMCSGRKACRYLQLSRSTYRYRRMTTYGEKEQPLIQRLEALTLQNPRYGYRRITALLRHEGWYVSKRHIQRLRRHLGMRVPPPRKRMPRRGHTTGLPTMATHKNHVWTWDFIADATKRGGSIRMLTILDEYTRECHILRVDRSLKSADVLEWMGKAIDRHGAPEYLRSDNGSEFIAKIVQKWLREKQIKTLYIDPGSPWQNGFVESFHGRFRDECLNREQLWTLTEARVVIEDYRNHDNQQRPHSKLGYLGPTAFAQQQNPLPSPTPVGLRPPSVENGQPKENT